MTTSVFAKKRRFTINGIDVSILADIVVDKEKKEEENFDVHDHMYGVHVELEKYDASGSLSVKAIDALYGNDPMTFIDLLSLISGYSEYDTTNSIVKFVVDSHDATEHGAGYANMKGKMAAPRKIELRQTEATASHAISDSGAADEAWAQSFIAAGEDMVDIKLKIFNKAGDIVTSFELELWDDSASLPNAKLAGTNTVLVHCSGGADDATNDYIGALTVGATFADATWEDIDMTADTPNLLGTASLTIGTTYWLVIRNVLAANKNLYVCYSTNDNTETGEAKQDDDVDNSPLWGDAPANTKDITFIIQFEAAEGHTIIIYDYKNATEGYYMTYTGVRFTPDSGVSMGPKQVAEGSFKWTAAQVAGPTAF